MAKIQNHRQLEFQKTHWRYRYSHGGQLRNSRKGRGARPLSSKTPIHLVLKANKCCLRGGFRTYKRYFLIHHLLDKYSKKFFIRIEQVTVQNDHIHLLIRGTKRSHLQNFFRVFSGQIAQRFQRHELLVWSRQERVTGTPQRAPNTTRVTDTPRNKNKAPRVTSITLWKHRPFTRIVKGWKAYKIVEHYLKLNELEATNKISYQKRRLRGLSSSEWYFIFNNCL